MPRLPFVEQRTPPNPSLKFSLRASFLLATLLANICVRTQATTTAEHTLGLENFEGREYEGALLYVTLSVNDFTYQSIEEVDPVDWWALLGAVGGVWGE